MANFIPNRISVLNKNNIVAVSKNEINREIYQVEDITLFLKEQLQMNNFVDCFSLNDDLFFIACSSGKIIDGQNTSLLNTDLTKFDFTLGQLNIYIQSLWRAYYKGSIEEGNGYLSIPVAYFAIGGVKNIIYKEYDKSSVDLNEGYLDYITFIKDTEEDEIMNYFNITSIALQDKESQETETAELLNKYDIIWNNKYYEIQLYKIDFDRIIRNYSLDFFKEKILTQSYLNLNFVKNNSQGEQEQNTYKYPINLTISNKLVQICNGDLSDNNIYFEINSSNLILRLLLWCPDNNYLNYTVNNYLEDLVEPEVEDFGFSYKLFTFTFNIDNYVGGESFYYTLNCFYNQGTAQDNQVFTINLNVKK